MYLHAQGLLNMDKNAFFGFITTAESSEEKPGSSVLTYRLEEKMFQEP